VTGAILTLVGFAFAALGLFLAFKANKEATELRRLLLKQKALFDMENDYRRKTEALKVATDAKETDIRNADTGALLDRANAVFPELPNDTGKQ